ncbi:MAG: DUF4956 domain-containing protein [Gemmatimonadaceae bacterium]|nr:DUF4956 domain-containing protein [Gemmatimonadaceae bacterium]MDQ3242829.1 DUF4956 domain-containing protein [Gemmatimonadota bacterium]
MATQKAGTLDTPATKVVVKCVVYYAVVIGLGALVWSAIPRTGFPVLQSLGSAMGAVGPEAASAVLETTERSGAASLTLPVVVAMVAAILVSIPVAWVYQLTRAKRGYQQSVVQLLIILPLVVSGIVVLVKFSLALAFSLAGIVAAVRFRNTLEDSKDAVYVFLATGIGLAAAVDITVAAAISIVFNATMLVLWYTDFGNAPVELEGQIAQRRLQRAKKLARTGTFVAQIDHEVLRNMNREQLEGLAQRAWHRAHDQDRTGAGAQDAFTENHLKVKTRTVERTRAVLEPNLSEYAKEWRFDRLTKDPDGNETIHYMIQLKKKANPEDLVGLVRATTARSLIDVEFE